MQFDTAGDGDRQARTQTYVTKGDGARSGKMCRYCAVKATAHAVAICAAIAPLGRRRMQWQYVPLLRR